jgi:hypothetical protein
MDNGFILSLVAIASVIASHFAVWFIGTIIAGTIGNLIQGRRRDLGSVPLALIGSWTVGYVFYEVFS